MLAKTAVLSALSALAAVVPFAAASTFEPLKPPSIPLAVRSPYLSTWLNGDSGGLLPGSWPKFWANQYIGWLGLIRVDGTPFTWMGEYNSIGSVAQVAFNYTSTKSIFTFDVGGKVTLTATFLSPVYPNDMLAQSMQFSHLHLSAASSDGKTHRVQIYSDVSGEWASGDHARPITWSSGVSSDNEVAYHKFQLRTQEEFSEYWDTAKWGSWFYGVTPTPGLKAQAGVADVTSRAQFVSRGSVNGTSNTNFRAINDNWPVFAFSTDLGNLTATPSELLFSVGLTQENVIQYQSPSGLKSLPAYWKAKYDTPEDVFHAFHANWDTASKDADALDSKVHDDAFEAGGADYAALTSLVVRQTFGTCQVADSGEADPFVFVKEISSDSDIQTVDVIFPMHPILLYLNPDLLRFMLNPLFEYQESGVYPNKWSIHDLGYFPNALGHADGQDEAMPVEECGDMIIMMLAHAIHSKSNDYLAEHWPILDQWAQYLVNDSLIPDEQFSTDDFAGRLANQTNLALKGIIGIRAMSDIANRSGDADAVAAGSKYLAIANDYLAKWQKYGITKNATLPHTTLAYGQDDTHGLLYNIYADKLLDLNFVPKSVYTMQEKFYETVLEEFGIPLDSRHDWAKSDWEMFIAAVSPDGLKADIISRVARMVESSTSYRPLTDLYDASTANFPADGAKFINRPVLGGFFALLAL